MGFHALDGVRILEFSDELAAYAGRLLADLGAEVIRVVPPEGTDLRRAAPIVASDRITKLSTFDRFVNAGKRSVTIDVTQPDGVELLAELLATADLVIESPAPVLGPAGFDRARLNALSAGIGQVVVTPFGLDHPKPWAPVDDLIVMAAGGLLHLGGYEDIGPVAAYGGQSRFAASIFAAVAALSALLSKELDGDGGVWDVSAQECIAQALEDSASAFALTGNVRERQGDRAREAGSGVYRCADGYVSMVAGRLGTARAWAALVAWLNESDASEAADLRAECWSAFEYRQSPDAIDTFARIFGAFASTRTKLELYEEGQARRIAITPINTVQDVLASPQLRSREFFTRVLDAESRTELIYPKAPYRLSKTPPAKPRSAPCPDDDTYAIFVEELGMSVADYRALVERGVL